MESADRTPVRTLILGGGGAVGIGWQVGLLIGLRDAGLDLTTADAVLGTSAGAFVGALLTSGQDISQALTGLQGLAGLMQPAALKRGNDLFLDTMSRIDRADDVQTGLRRIGQVAQQADTVAEDKYLALFDLVDTTWPSTFHCTGIDADTGSLTVWGKESRVSLRAAVAASCALPMLFPVVNVADRPHFDGGLASHLNATSAPAGDIVVALSCHPLQDHPGSPLKPSELQAVEELDRLRENHQMLAVEPEFGDIGASSTTMMDPHVARRAVQAGLDQATSLAPVVTSLWNG
jgi:NTE family protein